MTTEECNEVTANKLVGEVAAVKDEAPIKVGNFVFDAKSIDKIPVEDNYLGPRLDSVEDIDLAFCRELIKWFEKGERLNKRSSYLIMHAARELMKRDPNLVHIRLPSKCTLNICGDIHGQFDDLSTLFKKVDYPSEIQAYLFNGDIVDRGRKSVECLITLLAYKVALPDRFFIARGNHECRTVNANHGFKGECIHKIYPSEDAEEFFELANHVMDTLPLAHVVADRVFVVHGGLPKKKDFILSDIDQLQRIASVPEGGMLSELLWSDPRDIKGYGKSFRCDGVFFGADVTKAFLERNGLSLMIRSHEVAIDGYDTWHDGLCITLFSAPNYNGHKNRQAAVIRMRPDGTSHTVFRFTSNHAIYNLWP